jgi:hypothetical protein
VVKKNCPQEDRTTWLRSRREKTGNNSDAARSTFDGEFSNEDKELRTPDKTAAGS